MFSNRAKDKENFEILEPELLAGAKAAKFYFKTALNAGLAIDTIAYDMVYGTSRVQTQEGMTPEQQYFYEGKNKGAAEKAEVWLEEFLDPYTYAYYTAMKANFRNLKSSAKDEARRRSTASQKADVEKEIIKGKEPNLANLQKEEEIAQMKDIDTVLGVFDSAERSRKDLDKDIILKGEEKGRAEGLYGSASGAALNVSTSPFATRTGTSKNPNAFTFKSSRASTPEGLQDPKDLGALEEKRRDKLQSAFYKI